MLKTALYVFALTFLLTCAFQLIGRFIINYDIKGKRIRILLFSLIPVFTIEIDEDLESEELLLAQTIKPKFSRLNLTNRFVGRVVEIRRKRGLIRLFSLTPDDPVSFLRQIRHAQLVGSDKSQ